MKRELETEALGPDGAAFFLLARDVLHQLVWSEDDAPSDESSSQGAQRRKDVVKTLRGAMTASKPLYRALVRQPLLWQSLLKEARPGISTVVWSQMHSGDLIQLMRSAYDYTSPATSSAVRRALHWGDALQDAQFLGALGGRSPGRFLDELESLLSVLTADITASSRHSHTSYDALRRRLFATPDPLGFLLSLIVAALMPYDPQHELALQPEEFAALIVTLQGSFSYTPLNQIMARVLAPLQRLVQLWPEQRARCDAMLQSELRGEIEWAAWRLQTPDEPLSIVPRAEMPWEYVLFWYVIMTQYIGIYGHRMFHACVGCFEPLNAQSECCWHRDAPNQLYCNADCFTRHQEWSTM